MRAGVDYEASMAAAKTAAASGAGQLLSDSSWEGYTQAPHRLMEGYLAMIDEAATQIPTPPTHILSLIHIPEPTRQRGISYAVFCLKKKKKQKKKQKEKK